MNHRIPSILPLGLLFLLMSGCASLPPLRSAHDANIVPSRPLPSAKVMVATNAYASTETAATNISEVAGTTSASNAISVTVQARPAEPKPALLSSTFRQILAVQTLMDRDNYSCGCADGAFGPRTRQALEAWQARNDLPVTGELDTQTLEMMGDLEDAFTTHTVTAEEITALAPIPTTWQGKSDVATLGYETVLEHVAEKYHASQNAIRRLNPGVAWPDPPEGTMLKVTNPKGVLPSKAAKVTVSLAARIIRAYDGNGHLIALFPCSIGQNKSKRPVGELKVQNCANNPDFTFDPAVFPESGETHKYLIPPGPNNPVGTAWIGLDLTGYGIHGTPHPEDIGKTESHGCFRLANWNAVKLLKIIEIGTPVIVEP